MSSKLIFVGDSFLENWLVKELAGEELVAVKELAAVKELCL